VSQHSPPCRGVAAPAETQRLRRAIAAAVAAAVDHAGGQCGSGGPQRQPWRADRRTRHRRPRRRARGGVPHVQHLQPHSSQQPRQQDRRGAPLGGQQERAVVRRKGVPLRVWPGTQQRRSQPAPRSRRTPTQLLPQVQPAQTPDGTGRRHGHGKRPARTPLRSHHPLTRRRRLCLIARPQRPQVRTQDLQRRRAVGCCRLQSHLHRGSRGRRALRRPRD
jgi:hypothetical protein